MRIDIISASACKGNKEKSAVFKKVILYAEQAAFETAPSGYACRRQQRRPACVLLQTAGWMVLPAKDKYRAFPFYHPVESVLDVGCASGVLAETLIGACQRYTGIDTELAEPGGYRAAQGERAVFRKADIRRTDFPDNSFDAVFLFSVLEHIQELDAVMHEVKRILKPQGECIAGFPQVNFFMRACFGLIGFHEAQECHINRPSRILKAISSVFSVKKIKTIPPGFSHQTALYTCVKAVKQ